MDTVHTEDGVELAYELAGEGPTVAFVPTVGFGAWQWAWQHEGLAGPFQTLVYDSRGTGRSEQPAGPYELDRLVADLEAVLAATNTRRVHLVGQGFGSLLALEYARRFGRARSLALIGTPEGTVETTLSRFEETVAAEPEQTKRLRESLSPLLSQSFREAQPEVVDGIVEWRAGDATLEGWQSQLAAFEDYTRSWPLYEVALEALVCHGSADQLVDPACSARLASDLPNAERVTFEDAGHLVTVERSRPLNDRLLGQLEAVTGE